MTPSESQELLQLLKDWGCTIPENPRTEIVGCFKETEPVPAAPRAGSAAMPNCPAPSNVDEVYYTRKYACSHVNQTGIFVSATSPPTVVGTESSNIAWEEWLDHTSREWKRTVYYQNIFATVPVPSLLMTEVTIDCAAVGCGYTDSQAFTAQKGVVQTHTHTMKSDDPPLVAFPEPQTRVTKSYPRAKIEGLAGYVGPPTGVRCDSLPNVTSSGKPGCVYYWYTPTYVLDSEAKRAMPNIVENILYGQLALRKHPGFFGNNNMPGGQHLVRGPKRVVDPKTGRETSFSRLSRNVACPESIPRPPPNDSCDEYPFASTWQGAEWVNGDDWTCRLVPTDEQQFQAHHIASFYNNNRLWRNPDGTVIGSTGSRKQGAFWVWVNDAPSAPPSFPQCQNHM